MSGETLPALGGKADKIRFDDKAPRGMQILLYTEGHVTIKGIWQDGSGILGWAPLPEVDKAERDACYAHPHKGMRKKIMAAKDWSSNPVDANGKQDIESHVVESSQINNIGYSHSRKVMLVNFKNGSSYEYANVEHERFKAVLEADSVGKAFNSLIKAQPDVFPFTKL